MTKRGDKIAISKVMCGDPLVLWKITASTKDMHRFTAQPLWQFKVDGECVFKITDRICERKLERECCWTHGVNGVETTRSTRWRVDNKGKLIITDKLWVKLPGGGGAEITITVEAKRD